MVAISSIPDCCFITPAHKIEMAVNPLFFWHYNIIFSSFSMKEFLRKKEKKRCYSSLDSRVNNQTHNATISMSTQSKSNKDNKIKNKHTDFMTKWFFFNKPLKGKTTPRQSSHIKFYTIRNNYNSLNLQDLYKYR